MTLVLLADDSSPIFTLGCDLGSHIEPTHVPRHRREVAGGYVQIASVKYYQTKTEAYAKFANVIVTQIRSLCDKDHWKVDFVGTWVNFQFESEPSGVHPSLWIWFFAAAGNQVVAMDSRERLIGAVCQSLISQSRARGLLLGTAS